MKSHYIDNGASEEEIGDENNFLGQDEVLIEILQHLLDLRGHCYGKQRG
jgi:hypothetical protein